MRESRSKSGQGAVIANLILIASSVLMTSIVLFWTLALQQSTQAGFATSIFTTTSQASEQFRIEEVYFRSTPSKAVVIYIRNFGDIAVSIDSVFIGYYTGGTGQLLVTRETFSAVTTVARSVQAITISYEWSAGTYNLRIASRRGNIFEGNYEAS